MAVGKDGAVDEEPAAMREKPRSVREALGASDPGLVRLVGAANTVLAICLTLAVLWAFGFATPYLVAAGSSALVWSMVLTGPLPGEQAVTHALSLPVALASATVAVLLKPYPEVSGAVFVVLLFVTVYVRRYGPRGTALGMNAFQMYFVMQFVTFTTAELPRLWAAVAVAFGCGAVVRFALLRTTPARSFARLQRSVRTCLADLASALADLVGDGTPGPVSQPRLRAVQRRLVRLHTCALMLQDSVELCASPPVADLVRSRMTEADVRAERMVVMVLRAVEGGTGATDFAHRLHLPGDGSGPAVGAVAPDGPAAGTSAPSRATTLAARVRALGPALAGGPFPRPAPLPPDTDPVHVEAHLAVEDFEQAAAALRDAFRGDPRQAAPHAPTTSGADPATPGRPASGGPVGWSRPTTRAAVQVACGAALATVGGQLISVDHWYWAVLACWMVFFNTSSTGEIALKGYRRVLGTAAGMLVGIAVAAGLAGHPWGAFLLTLVCVFGMAYTAALSYTVATFFITLMIALLSDLLGDYTGGLLLIRMAETGFGVVCGVLAAVVILPRATARQTDVQFAAALAALAGALEETVRRVTGPRAADPGPGTDPGSAPRVPAARATPVRAAQALDRAVAELARSVTPVVHPVAPHRNRRSAALRLMGLLETCAYHARTLAVEAERVEPGAWSRASAEPLLEEAVGAVNGKLTLLAARITGEDSDAGDASDTGNTSDTGGAGRTRGSGGATVGSGGVKSGTAVLGPEFGARVAGPGVGPDAVRFLRHFQRLDDDVRAMERVISGAVRH
ncbi:FUSC family protein [Streptomyces sp. NPDC057939]|uniref:FUSC family protein n=1 Tax=Streptomyces sp. NPDC057939 TaxID=3346284 RepID=UPI0036E48E56